MKLNWRKWNRILHRDLGYFFFGMTIIYAISGIALNHLNDWNPSYTVTRKNVTWPQKINPNSISKANVLNFLDALGKKSHYKKHYRPKPQQLKIFLKGGSIEIDLTSGHGVLEELNRRPVLYEVNFLHYNPSRLWTWFSDLFCVALVVVAVTGLFILKGKNGITRRGAWLTGVGLAIPLIMLLFYL